MAVVYCYASESYKPTIPLREDAIEPADVFVFTGCEYKIKFVNTAGGRKESECDGTVYVDDVRAHGSMRIGTIPYLPHDSCEDSSEIKICLVPSVSGQQEVVKEIRVIKCQSK